jgi:hypothetical protein
MREAENVGNSYNRKDIAHLFLNGVKAISRAYVADWLRDHFDMFIDDGEDLEESIQEILNDLCKTIKRHFGESE